MRFNHQIIESDQAPVDDEGELLLADDLALLGRQLTSEAQHLACCYPAADAAQSTTSAAQSTTSAAQSTTTAAQSTTTAAQSTTSAAASSRPQPRSEDVRSRVSRRLLASAGLVSLSLLGLLVAMHVAGPQADVPREVSVWKSKDEVVSGGELAAAKLAAANPRAEIGVARDTERVSDASPRSNPVSEAADESAELSPIMFLHEVSAPELEGWCDLIEERDAPEADLSI
ncbi:MAG: hypothetical protein RIC55_25920 [Pirellulaceae bacterium]